MTFDPVSPKEKKLRNLRKILWIIFAAITITILLVFGLSIPIGLVINQATNFLALFSDKTGLLVLSLLGIALMKIAVTGLICIIIYQIVKYRIEKDDDLFL
jgi:hypothetical protein